MATSGASNVQETQNLLERLVDVENQAADTNSAHNFEEIRQRIARVMTSDRVTRGFIYTPDREGVETLVRIAERIATVQDPPGTEIAARIRQVFAWHRVDDNDALDINRFRRWASRMQVVAFEYFPHLRVNQLMLVSTTTVWFIFWFALLIWVACSNVGRFSQAAISIDFLITSGMMLTMWIYQSFIAVGATHHLVIRDARIYKLFVIGLVILTVILSGLFNSFLLRHRHHRFDQEYMRDWSFLTFSLGYPIFIFLYLFGIYTYQIIGLHSTFLVEPTIDPVTTVVISHNQVPLEQNAGYISFRTYYSYYRLLSSEMSKIFLFMAAKFIVGTSIMYYATFRKPLDTNNIYYSVCINMLVQFYVFVLFAVQLNAGVSEVEQRSGLRTRLKIRVLKMNVSAAVLLSAVFPIIQYFLDN